MNKKYLSAYIKVWLKLTAQQFQQQVANSRVAAVIFIFGKVFRLATAFLLIYVVVGRAKLIAGYNLNQAVLILLFFNLISTITQLFLRGAYIFRQKIIDGTFDFYLLNPLSELFYSLFSYTDPLDTLLLLPYILLTGYAWISTGYPITFLSVIGVILIIILSFIIVMSWHIIIIGVGVRYLEVDNTIMLYRDLERMASFPVDIYGKVGGFLLTYLAPFALMATIPAKLVFGLFNPWGLLIFAALTFLQLKFALWYWKRSLLSYSSASS